MTIPSDFPNDYPSETEREKQFAAFQSLRKRFNCPEYMNYEEAKLWITYSLQFKLTILN
jgi:hypothetical protein